MDVKGARRCIYFKKSELDLLEFIESKNGNFATVMKEMIKQAQAFEKKDAKNKELVELMRHLVSDIKDIKNELKNLEQIPMQAAFSLPNAKNDRNASEIMQVVKRDNSGFYDL